MLLYPVYALLFAETGLSAAEISSLFIIWSLTSFLLEVPSGVWADVVSRRLLLTFAPALAGAGYALWTFVPCYPSFAIGFLLWGVGGAMRSGALQALVYSELAHIGAPDAYARLIGRSQAIATTAIMIATAVAAPVLAAGGYRAVGIASVAVTLLGVGAGWLLPESSRRPDRESPETTETAETAEAAETAETAGIGDSGDGGDGADVGYAQVLRGGIAELRRVPMARRRLVLYAALMGISALDEYIPLLVQATGVGPAAVPLLVLLVMVGFAVGGWAAGRGRRWSAPALAVGAACLAVGAASGHPAGLVFVAAAYGIFEWAVADADARLQESIADQSRATVTSMAGLGAEMVAVLAFAAYALGATWAPPGLLFAAAAVPYLALALAVRYTRDTRKS